MTHVDTAVRLRSRGGDDVACAGATLTARPGEIAISAAGTARALRVGADVVAARFDDSVGMAGRVALLGPGGEPAAVVDLDDWLPPIVNASDLCRGGLRDPLEWTGLQELAGTAGIPLERGRVPQPADVDPCSSGPGRVTLAASVGLSLAGVLWVGALLAEGRLFDRIGVAVGLLAVTTLCCLVLFLQERLRDRRDRRLPQGEVLMPRPSTAVTRRFRRETRLVLVPAQGPLDVLVVRDSARRQLWIDGPSSPLGVHRAVVVTPPGAPAPERVDLVDGLGREVVRLPWSEWFGGDEESLDRLAARGVAVERTGGTALGPMAGAVLLAPRSTRYPTTDWFTPPGAFGVVAMTQVAGAATVAPIALAVSGYGSPATLGLGIANGVLMFGPAVVRTIARFRLDVPRLR